MTRFRAIGAAGLLAASLLSFMPAGQALAHHSFAVFFTADKDVTSIKGAVSDFKFTNPHGTIDLLVPGENGAQEHWRVETNSPSILLRRGWTKNTLAIGEVITIQGWRAQDGSKYMRLRNAMRANGSPIGTLGQPVAAKP